MRRREPPLLATWMLEHLTPAGGDEALAAICLRNFGAAAPMNGIGGSTVSVLSFLVEQLAARGSLLVFALLWSILAPHGMCFATGLRTARSSTNCGNLLEGFGYFLRLQAGLFCTPPLFGRDADFHRGA